MTGQRPKRKIRYQSTNSVRQSTAVKSSKSNGTNKEDVLGAARNVENIGVNQAPSRYNLFNMKIVIGYPPNIEEIKKRFSIRPDVIFTYEDALKLINLASI